MQTKMNLLLVEDDEAIVTMLRTVLKKEGFTSLDRAATKKEALRLCDTNAYDFMLLDVTLPDGSGLDLCKEIRAKTNAVILFVSARDSDFDKLTGFALGADDYITKPFNPLEIVARIKSRIYRVGHEQTSKVHPAFVYHDFTVDPRSGTLVVRGEEVTCPAQVFQLLLHFCNHPNQVFNKEQLYDQAWNGHYYGDDHTVTVHIRRLREKIELIQVIHVIF
ncbi:response regulator transcription factor [Bacillus sp. JCM 19041]|uniref:response regulator transcription factor n=1 Tax=Bacillus sp. JCM 19041 TaxID=1460637 RepID=UPI000A9E09D7